MNLAAFNLAFHCQGKSIKEESQQKELLDVLHQKSLFTKFQTKTHVKIQFIS